MIRIWSVTQSLIRSWRASSKSSAFSRISAAWHNVSATIVFNTMLGSAMDAEEPTIRNSNLLPVNANGDVLLRSVASLLNLGTVDTPVSSWLPSRLLVASPFSHNWLNTSSSWSPRNTEMIAGGASLAPSLWSLPGVAADIRSNGA